MAIKEAAREPAAMRRRIYLLATSEDGARVALETARQLAADQDAELVVLVPHVVPYGTDLARCGHDLAGLGEPYRALVLASGVSATVRVCACREIRHLFSLLLVDRGQLLIPGRRRRWWRSRDERLARALECDGHHVQFIDVDAQEAAVDTVAGAGRPRLRLVEPPASRTALRTEDRRSHDFGHRPGMARPRYGVPNE